MQKMIDYDTIVKMLLRAADTITGNGDLLTKLDSVIGDGDHGPSMVRAMGAVSSTVSADTSGSIGKLLFDVGWAVMSIDGGSTGPLLGSLFMGMGDGAGETVALDCPATVSMFEAGVAKMQKSTRAQVGDKTMMDALLPALDAMRAAADSDPASCLGTASAAAAEGAEATKEMVAKFGRARNLGNRVIGHMDPGAKSISLILAAFSDAVSEN